MILVALATYNTDDYWAVVIFEMRTVSFQIDLVTLNRPAFKWSEELNAISEIDDLESKSM